MTKKEIKTLLEKRANGDYSDSILEFISSNVSAIPYISLEQLAFEANTNISELMACFNALGFEDFIELKRYLRNTNYFEKKGNQLIEKDIQNIAAEMMRCEMQNLTEFFGNLDYDMLDRLCEDITAASEVAIFGLGTASSYASYAVNMFNKIGIKTTFISFRDVHFSDYLLNLSHSTLLISFGFARYSKSLVIANNILKKRGFHLVAVTDSIHSPLAALADYSFILPIHSVDFSDSSTAGMQLINLISFKIGLTNRENLMKHLEYFEDLNNDLDSFF